MVPCTYGKGEPHACRPERRCDYCVDGLEETWESPAPEVNVANVTAGVLLAVLRLDALRSLPGELYGYLTPEEIPGVRRRIVYALSTGLPERNVIPASESGGPNRARIINFGLDAERIRDRLARLDSVLAYAQEHGQRVSWG
jgi:hypothetical protein